MKRALKSVKKTLYFPFAMYFAFWAKVFLKRWKPKIVTVTGSAGKTTALNLIETQLGDNATYSHGANSAFGLAFNVLGINDGAYSIFGWLKVVVVAPFRIFRKLPKHNLYITEADCDRPGEGKFTGKLLRPDIVIWVSSGRTHSMNFSELKSKKNLSTVEEAIAYSFAELVGYAKHKVLLLQPNQLMKQMTQNIRAEVETIEQKDVRGYEISALPEVKFSYGADEYKISQAVGKDIVVSAIASIWLMQELAKKDDIDSNFTKFILPPGRSSVFSGLKQSTLIDGTYNSNMLSMTSLLGLLDSFPGKVKWAVIGDMVEQGEFEKAEHVKLAELISKQNLDQVILYGRRTKKYTLPRLNELGYKGKVISIESPQEVSTYLTNNIKGNEVILFHGAGFLESVVESLLENPSDASKLCRREPIWQKRRAKWGI